MGGWSLAFRFKKAFGRTVALIIGQALSTFVAGNLEAGLPATRVFTTADGLVRNLVGRIYKDSHGRLWFCTAEGLSLFDGQQFINYRTDDGLPDRIVNDIAETAEGSYLLATGGGLFVFHPRTLQTARFEPVIFNDAKDKAVPQVLLRTKSGDFYCGTEHGGLYRIRAANIYKAEVLNLGRTNFGGYGIEALAETEDGSIWAGGGELIRLKPGGQISEWSNHREVPYRIHALLVDSEGSLWVGGSDGIDRFDLTGEPLRIWYCPRFSVLSLRQDQAGRIWVGTLGLHELLLNEQSFLRSRLPSYRAKSEYMIESWSARLNGYDKNSLLGSQWISDMATDSAGNFWVALGNVGAARLSLEVSQYSVNDGLEAPQVQSVFETSDGTLYAVSGRMHTLNRFDGRRFKPIPLRTPPEVRFFGWGEDRLILRDGAGEWWVATGEGLLRYRKVKSAESLSQTLPTARYVAANGLPDSAITRVFEDDGGNIWIGTGSGVARWVRASESIENYTAQLAQALHHPPSALSFAMDKSGAVWIGFFQGGLARFRGGQMQVIEKGLPAGSINALLTDREGRLWVGSSRGGLARVDDPCARTPQVTGYQNQAGLPSRHLYALAQDHSGRLYVAGGQGVDRYNPANGQVDHFDVNNGLPEGETQRLYCDQKGGIWFASNFGLSRLEPEANEPIRPANPVIHQLVAGGRRVAASDEGVQRLGGFQFPANWNSIEISYGSTFFASDDALLYRYRLIGLDPAWHQATAARSITYGGLGPGSYRFEVQPVSSNGLLCEKTANIEFSIAAPFWRTWWFLTLSAVILAAAGVGWHRRTLAQAVALERMRAGFAADLHDDLGSGLAEIALVSEVAARQGRLSAFEELAQRARELRESMYDIVWSADPRRERLAEFVPKCRQAAFSLGGDRSLEFRVQNPQHWNHRLAPTIRRALLLFIKESLTNVMRHANAAKTRVDLGVTRDSLRLKVSDDGVGFSEQINGSGNGLVFMRERAAAIGASVSIRSKPGEGTVVELVVPLREGSPRWISLSRRRPVYEDDYVSQQDR